MKTALCFVSVLVAGAFQLEAVSVWTESGAKIDEVVANDKTAPPPNLMQPLLINAPFSNFRYPHVDAHENVTFIADDPVFHDKALHHGIYRSIAATEELRPLVRQGEAPPGVTFRFDWFRGLQVDGADFVFNATDNERGRGLYYWSDGAIRMIARTRTTTLPGVGQALTNVEYGAVSGERVLYNARAGRENLLVLHELKTGQNRVICRSGIDIPRRTGEQFRYFSPQNWLDRSNIVFRAANVDDPHKKSFDGAGRRGLYAWLAVDWRRSDPAFDTAGLVTLADGSTTVPLLGPTARFTDFRSAPIRDGLVAFVAGGADFNGIYYSNIVGADRSVHPVVDSESALEGLFAGRFERFGIFCTVFDKSIVFVGYANGGYVGVFLYRTDRDELFLLCDNRTRIENKQVEDFEIAGDFLVRNRFAVTANFADQTSGVYLATIPPRSFKRLIEAKK